MKRILGRWAQYLAIGLGAVSLSACQSLVPRTTPPQTTVETPTTPSDQGDQQIENALPSDAQRHRIALLLPLSGKDSAVGQSIANATMLALLDTKANNIRITNYDTARGAAAAAQRAIADGNKLILGPLFGDNVAPVAAVARPANVPIVSFSNDVGVAGSDVFIIGYVPAQSIDRVVDYAKSQGITRFAGLVPNGTYGQRASSSLLTSVKQVGGSVVTLQSFDRTTASLQAAIKRMQRDSEYQALLIADSGAMASKVVPLIRENGGADAQILGTELWNTDNSLVRSADMRGAWFASVPDGLYRQYAAKYRQQFGSDPFRLSSLGYDAVLLTTRIARGWKPGSAFPTDKLRDQGGFVGIDGTFRFNRFGIAERLLEVQQVGSGTLSVVSPAPKSFEK